MTMIPSERQLPHERNKVSNVLVRYCCNKELRAEKDYLHPENAYLAKYFPKYYQSLSLVMEPQHSLLSKIKRIKRMKRLIGELIRQIPQVDWFKILGNNRKEIEELPEIKFSGAKDFFWEKTGLHAVRFFFRITKLRLPTNGSFSSRTFQKIWKVFSGHLRNLRRLRTLKTQHEYHWNDLKPLFNKLNGMPRLLGKLEVLKSSLRSNYPSDVLQNKNFLSYVTKLDYLQFPSEVYPICQAIPQICKNLKSLSLRLGTGRPVHSHYLDFITPIQELPKLQSISISGSKNNFCDFWSLFIPPASLRKLKLNFLEYDRTTFEGFTKQENLFDHWKEIRSLETLNFKFCYKNTEEVLFVKNFLTAMLKKISKLTSFKCGIFWNHQGIWRYEPFNAEEVPHLYEHLKKFHIINLLEEEFSVVRFDFSFLKPFKNLKNIDFQGLSLPWINIGDAICLLEENKRNGEFPTLKLKETTVYYPEELKKVSEVKRLGTNLKIELSFEFYMEDGKSDEIKYLDELCEIIESKTTKGLEISLKLFNSDCSGHHFDEVKRVLGKYSGIRNFTLIIYYEQDSVEYIKRDGEKEQLWLN